MPLSYGIEGKIYLIKTISSPDEEFISFLFSLGCYSGEQITLVAQKKNSCTIAVKNARYNIDKSLAESIQVEVA